MTEPKRRFLALWLPFLSTDRLVLEHPSAEPCNTPLALIEQYRGALRLAACNSAALAIGLSSAMTLADARSRVPELIVRNADPLADHQWLERMADACERFTPMVEAEAPDGLILDMTGCLHLFDGEAALIEAVEARMARWASHVKIAMAGTPEGARALARFQKTPAHGEEAAVRRLPVAALELDSDIESALRHAGLKTIGALADQPSAPLAARFGSALVDRLDRVLGRSDSRITSRQTPKSISVDRHFAEPVTSTSATMAVLGELAGEAASILESRQLGGRQFVAKFYRSDGHVITLAVESSLPLRDPVRIRCLFEEQINALADPIDPGFGFDMIRFAVPRSEPLAPTQLALEGGGTKDDAVAALVDRLSTRVGRHRVRRFVRRDSHIPEQESLALPAIESPDFTAWRQAEPDEPPLRPIHLFNPPQPVEVLAGLPDGPPKRFRWRRALHEIRRAEGPERIAAEWWQQSTDARKLTRDYYRVEDVRGRRFWLFRNGLYDSEESRPQWYIHGLFA